MNLKSQTRYAQTVRFFNDSLRLNLYLFSPYDILSKAGNLLLFRCTRNNSLDIYVLEGRRNKKVVAHSSGLQKLENSNLKILKFEARFAYAVKFWTDFFDWIFHNFFQMTHSATIFFVYFNAYLVKFGNCFCFTEIQCCWTSTFHRDRESRKPVCTNI